MRCHGWMSALALAAGCGFQVSGGTANDPDAGRGDGGDDAGPDGARDVPARLLPGGGIADAPIDGMVNVYVVDALTRLPVLGARVDVGTATGMTDATGLFVARGISGKQTVVVTKAGYRAEVWVGVQGANVTLLVRPSPMPPVPQANLSGTIPAITGNVPMSHYKLGLVTYSDHDDQLDVENALTSTGNTNYCVAPACAYTVTTRTGTVSLLGGLYDIDTKGTANGNDDTAAFLGWAVETGISVMNGVPQANHTLALLPANQVQNVTVDLGGAPGGYTPIGVVGLEVSPHEVLNLQGSVRISSPAIKAPVLSVVPNSRYRLTALLTDGNGSLGFVIRRGQTTSTLAAGTWFTPPPPATGDRVGASWTPPVDATLSGVVFRDGATELVSITAFDGSVAAMIPPAVTLPVSSSLTVQSTALRATFDVKSFAYDTDRTKIDGAAIGRTVPLN